MRKFGIIQGQTTPSIALVVDGEDEVWYLQMLKRNERSIRFNIKPEIPAKKSIDEQYELVQDLIKREFSKVFWLVDLDAIIKETKECHKGKVSPLNKFLKYRASLLRKHKKVSVIVNNPCLEFWLLLHYERTTKYYETCSEAMAQLRRYLPDYEKTQKYYTKQDHDIYLKLKPYLNTAIRNSAFLGEFDEQDPTKAMCEMDVLFGCDELRKHKDGIIY